MTKRRPELFEGLTEEETAEVMALGWPQHLSAGESLFALGGNAHSLFIVLQGRVALSLPMRVRGREEEVLVEERFPGQALGWSALIPPHRFTLSARTLLESDVLALPRTALLAHFSANPRVGQIVAQNVAAVVGQRLHVFQAMWLREMQRVVELKHA
jgi:CRP-like cAMP-binding protein